MRMQVSAPISVVHSQRSLNLWRAAVTAALVVSAVGLVAVAITTTFGSDRFSDFGVFWRAGKLVLGGRNPYPAATFHALRGQDEFVYPAPAALAVAPLALLPVAVSAGAFLVLSIGAIVGSLYLIGVRDVRCYAVAFLSLTTVQGLALGTASPLLMLALAVVWRCRDRIRWLAAAATAAIGLKLFLAPMVIWLALTRRWQALAVSTVLSIAVFLTAWAVVGLSTLRSYPALLSALTRVEGRSGLSTYGLAIRLGLSATGAQAVVVVLVSALAALAFHVSRSPGNDRSIFAICVVVCLVASPIVWLHYFALLIVPIALISPNLSWAWALPVTSWVFAEPVQPAATWKIIAGQLVIAAVLVLAVRAWSQAPSLRRR
jgi:Glycosyltransferase family 87